MNKSICDIIELSNNPKGLIYKIHIGNEEKWHFLCAFSENKFWIRDLNTDNGENENKSDGTDDEKFVFRIDLEPVSNIESNIRRLSIRDDLKVIQISSAKLKLWSKKQNLKYNYLIKHFIHSDIGRFYKNDLMLFILDKIIDSSFDDSLLSANCRMMLEKFSKCNLGKHLLLRMNFYKYETYFDNTGICIWQKSPFVKSWFFEFYEILLKNDLEKYYPPENISGDLTRWFISPEKDLIQFLDFAKKARFRFND